MMKKMKKIDVLNDQVTRFAHDNKQTCSDNFVYIYIYCSTIIKSF